MLPKTRLTREEALTLALRRLFEQRGYRRYRMSNFESYDLYRANKSFLKSEGVITFTDATGRLMALKPDVTMSIVKHTRAGTAAAKLYYNESVFRTAPGTGEYREISQAGVEYIGANTPYAEAEVLCLAAESLAAIGEKWVLDVSHMGFVTGILDSMGFDAAARAAAQDALRCKNAHALRALALEQGAQAEKAESLAALAQTSGSFAAVLPAARALAKTPEMHAAADHLQAFYDALCAANLGAQVRLDLSLINDIDYYNGVIFQGYVQGVPHAVLAGGRYDNLMRRFEKPQTALGFALYLGSLDRLLAEKPACDADVLLLYEKDAPPAQVMRAVQTLLQNGESVRAETALQPEVRVRRTLRLCADGTMEVV